MKISECTFKKKKKVNFTVKLNNKYYWSMFDKNILFQSFLCSVNRLWKLWSINWCFYESTSSWFAVWSLLVVRNVSSKTTSGQKYQWLTEIHICLYEVITADPESDMNSLNHLFFPCLFYSLCTFFAATLSLSLFVSVSHSLFPLGKMIHHLGGFL